MKAKPSDAIRLFTFRGIDVFLHWSWFVVAVIGFQYRMGRYASPIFNVAEYLALFAIVLLHEFGHSFACRQVGGQANLIVLWPLGGVAHVAPPERPGAHLWSIVAGPLVNVILLPVFYALLSAARAADLPSSGPDSYELLRMVARINLGLLIFNILPVYPLDGGQILRSLLWFVVGRAKSLLIASIIGFVGAAGMACLAIAEWSIWYGVITFFLFSSCLRGWQSARGMMRIAAAPRRHEVACPACKESPPAGEFWLCSRCRAPFDMFAAGGICPQCQAHYAELRCPECGAWAPRERWAERV